MDNEELAAILEELIDVLRLQAKDLENLVGHLEQVTPRLGYTPQLSAVAAELNALHRRIQKLRGPAPPE
jgi:hypothetical protein